MVLKYNPLGCESVPWAPRSAKTFQTVDERCESASYLLLSAGSSFAAAGQLLGVSSKLLGVFAVGRRVCTGFFTPVKKNSVFGFPLQVIQGGRRKKKSQGGMRGNAKTPVSRRFPIRGRQFVMAVCGVNP